MLHFWKSEDQNQSQGARITELEYRYLKGWGVVFSLPQWEPPIIYELGLFLTEVCYIP